MWQRYAPLVWFLVRFIGAFALLTFFYTSYLDLYDSLDPLSLSITRQVTEILVFMGFEGSAYTLGAMAPYADIYCNEMGVMRIIEGCNAVSVMILFLAFLIAFTAPWKKYLWFTPLGIAILYLANIVRIVMIGVVQLKMPDYTPFVHDYAFPAVIYGTTVLLWLWWVKKIAR